MQVEEVRKHMIDTKTVLIRASDRLIVYLDEFNTRVILEENKSIKNNKEYIQQIFKQLRRMEVVFDEALLRLNYLLKTERLSQTEAEKTLFKIYHQCIMEFYSPRHDVWYEESRAVYADKMSIRFHQPPPLGLKIMFSELEPHFQYAREILDYYDTKHQTT